MFLRMHKSLSARREELKRDEGFTLIELLVVVIIIGILAAIAIPVFLGVQSNAIDSSVKSDLTNIKTAAVAYQTEHNGVLPTSLADISSEVTIDAGNYTATPVLSAAPDNSSFCVTATGSNGNVWGVTHSTAPTANETC